MMNSPFEDTPLLQSFIKGDDSYETQGLTSSWFFSPQGSWIVKHCVGKKASIIGQALEINYFHENLEVYQFLVCFYICSLVTLLCGQLIDTSPKFKAFCFRVQFVEYIELRWFQVSHDLSICLWGSIHVIWRW